MPLFDLGPQETAKDKTEPRARQGVARATITWTENATERSLLIMAKALVMLGRKSDCDLCLRLEPVTEPAHREATFQISSAHLALRYQALQVEVIDNDSTNGTFLSDGAKLEPQAARKIEPGTRVSVAGVLDLALDPVERPKADGMEDLAAQAQAHAADSSWLQEHLIGDDQPGAVAFLRVRRLNNRPEQAYALLYHSAAIGRGEHSLLPLPPETATPSRRVRALDVGEEVTADPARLLVRGGVLWIERTGKEEVTYGGKPLERGKPELLAADRDLLIAGMSFKIKL